MILSLNTIKKYSITKYYIIEKKKDFHYLVKNQLQLKNIFFNFFKKNNHYLKNFNLNTNKKKYIFIKHNEHHFHFPEVDKNLHQKEETKIVYQITWLGLVSNVLISFLKAFAGFKGNSAALVADAAHSLSDIFSDIITLILVKWSRKPANPQHPYGYGKFETIGAIIVSSTLVVTGISTSYHAWEHWISNSFPSNLALGIVFISILLKEILYRITVHIAKKQNSQLLYANAWHHRSDALSSLLALIGIAGSQLGIKSLDPIAALIVSGLIVKIGLQSAWISLKQVTDTEIDENLINSIHQIIEKIEGIIKIDKIRIRKMGSYKIIDINVELDPTMSLLSAYQISNQIKKVIIENIERVHEVIVVTIPHLNNNKK